jgi:hypothetical protein
MYEYKEWKDSEYTAKVRIKKEQLDFIKGAKGKKTIAGKLNEIINFYKKYGKDESNRQTPIPQRESKK